MNIIIIILSVILGFVVLILIIALFSKKAYALERSIVINKPVDEVFDYLKYIKNQDYFSKWVMTDPNMKKTFTGIDGTVGFIYAWEGNKKAGIGEQEIQAIIENKSLDIEVRFKKPFEGLANTPFSTESLSVNETKVTWGMNSEMKYPMNIFLLIGNIEKMLGDDIEISLNNLKEILEIK
jgi:uncharacterized protein YndB with AHSA1/START domain